MRLTPALIGPALLGGLLTALLHGPGPARAEPPADPAPVEFDFVTNLGFVDERTLREGFDWDAATLAANAARIEFQHSRHVADVYSVTCRHTGADPIRAVHTRQGARFFVTGVPVSGRPHTGEDFTEVDLPASGLFGFRLIGARAGISGTSVAPLPGTPCPRPAAAGETPAGGKDDEVRTARLVSTTVTTTLAAVFGERDTTLLRVTTGPDTGD